jgi:hypothetical protein
VVWHLDDRNTRFDPESGMTLTVIKPTQFERFLMKRNLDYAAAGSLQVAVEQARSRTQPTTDERH